MLTLTLALVFLGLLIAFWALWSSTLLVGLRCVGAPDVPFRRILLTGFLIPLVSLPFKVALFLTFDAGGLALAVPGAIAVAFAIPCLLIRFVCRVTAGQAIKGWFFTLAAEAGGTVFSLFVMQPYVVESYHMPTNSMAPTILGVHREAPCATCGAPAYYSVDSSPNEMICRDHFHVTSAPDAADSPVFGGDRVLVAKFAKPERWDLIAFRYPGNPAAVYLKRLVGLPGEEVSIHDGKVWINGQVLVPPEPLGEIEYLSEMGFGFPIAGGPGNPARLGADEYFVLGDFSRKSADSRMWQDGAPGHAPYAVPRDHILGVVTSIFWPPERCRTFR